MDCQNVQIIFSEVWQVLECLGSIKIIVYDFLKVSWIAKRSKTFSCSLASSAMSWKLQNNSLWFLKASWIARGSEISLLKFYKSWNVLEASKYLSMIFKSLLDCQRVRNIFTEVWQVLKLSWKLQNIFLWFLKGSWIARRTEISLLKFYKSWNVLEASKYLSMIFKSLLDCQRVKKTFLKFDKSWNDWQASKYFSMIFKRVLDCQKV